MKWFHRCWKPRLKSPSQSRTEIYYRVDRIFQMLPRLVLVSLSKTQQGLRLLKEITSRQRSLENISNKQKRLCPLRIWRSQSNTWKVNRERVGTPIISLKIVENKSKASICYATQIQFIGFPRRHTEYSSLLPFSFSELFYDPSSLIISRQCIDSH